MFTLHKMGKEFNATHRWKQYPGIEFEVNYETNKIRAKGKNDVKTSNWVNIFIDKNGIKYFTVKRERIYWWDLELITNN